MEIVFFILQPPFYEGTRTEFEVLLVAWIADGVSVLCSYLYSRDTNHKDRDSRSVLKACNRAMINCMNAGR